MIDTTLKRFWKYIVVDDITGCWLWTGYRDKKGYAKIYNSISKKKELIHIWSYKHYVGPIPTGLDLDHLCRNTSCANPLDVEPVTRRVNLLRGIGIAAINARKTHCPRNHPLSYPNLIIARNGTRRCKKCARADQARWHRKDYDRKKRLRASGI